MCKIKLSVITVLFLLFSQNSSDLLGLIQVMIVTFGEQPPVYAKRPDVQSSTPYPTQRKYLESLNFSIFCHGLYLISDKPGRVSGYDWFDEVVEGRDVMKVKVKLSLFIIKQYAIKTYRAAERYSFMHS